MEEQKEFKPQTPDTDIAVIDKRHTASAPVVQDESPNAAIMLALQKGTDPAIIEKLMDLAERQEMNIAKKAYVKAMAAFKSDPPKIYKERKAGFDHKSGQGRTEYSFAPLPIICQAVDPALSAQGLHYEWEHNQDEKNIIVTCIMTHDQGYSKKTSLRAPRDDSGKKNFIQSMGSTISYLERYTLLAICGLATHDMDNDAQTPVEYISTDQATEINDLIEQTSSNLKIFLKVAQAESVETITTDKYAMLKHQLEVKKSKLREPGQEG